MLTSVAPNGAPTPPGEYICVPIDDKWEPRVGDELRSREHGYSRTITHVVHDRGFTYTSNGGKFTAYQPYVVLARNFECFRPVAPVPPTITIKLPSVPPAVPSTDEMFRAIYEECSAIAVMLQGKNRAYGNSIADPIKVFSKADADERINVRLDDKISRLVHGKPDDNEDAELDFIGYLILRRAKRRVQGKS